MPSIHDNRAASTSLVAVGAPLHRALGLARRRRSAVASAPGSSERFRCEPGRGADRRELASTTGTVAVAIGCLPAPAKAVTLTVAIDAHVEFGANEIEAACPHVAAEQTQCRKREPPPSAPLQPPRRRHPERRCRESHRGAAVLGALDLSAADLDMVVAAEILFDRRRKPRRERVDLNRTAVEPPPKPEKGEQ